jgi:hypothetical protein
MELIGLPQSGTIRAYSLADGYGLTLDQAKALKTCTEKVSIDDPAKAAKLIEAELAQEFTFESEGGH